MLACVNLIFVYGPPAVGKYTVGRELAERTGYRLFHNHLTVPTVNAIFTSEGPARSRLLEDLRVVSIAAAAEAGIDLIFTAAYSGGPADEAFMQRIVDTVEATPGGRMMFVQLHAPRDVLLARVSSDSRTALNAQKLVDPDTYRRRLAKRDIMVSVRYEGVLLLDTTELTAQQAASRIIRHFGL
jgi:shikimate kinase